MTNQAYKINPKFEENNNDIFFHESDGEFGMYFKRMIDGKEQATDLSYFNDTEIEEEILIEA